MLAIILAGAASYFPSLGTVTFSNTTNSDEDLYAGGQAYPLTTQRKDQGSRNVQHPPPS